VIVHAVGARPNFVKMAPVIDALRDRGAEQMVVHTGQHYDAAMSADMLEDLAFPAPDRFLRVGSGTHGEQTGRILIGFEQVLLELPRVSMVVVGGDVNGTLACALAAAKLDVPVAHVEAGLRSRDWAMPEEINRVLTDRLSALLFTHSPEAGPNLIGEGIEAGRIHAVGNTMIDSLARFAPRAERLAAWEGFGLDRHAYVLVTLHRPSNVDDPGRLAAIAEALCRLAERHPVVFPVHPRTRARLQQDGIGDRMAEAGVMLTAPLPYLGFLSLEAGAGAILTDSGGVQEEASALGVPCFTLRTTTERPVTIDLGTNHLLGDDPATIRQVATAPPRPCTIPLWDGHAAERIADVILAAV
jgi:UDP-N-acetylglucosamine 2-epimerase (non-hydrolysing)